MIARVLNLIAVLLLVGAAVAVYRVKYESTLQAEKVAKLRIEIRRQKDAIALLKAEWAQLSRPDRIQALAQRHTELKPFDLARLERADRLDQFPDKPPPPPDLIGDMLEDLDQAPVRPIPQPRTLPRPVPGMFQ